MQTHILVVGATGIAGSAFLRHSLGKPGLGPIGEGGKGDTPSLADDNPVIGKTGGYPAPDNWQYTGLTRNSSVESKHPQLECVHVDILEDCTPLHSLNNITHVVFAGFVPESDAARQLALNTALLQNCLNALKQCPLEQVILLQGMKYYGSHNGRFRTPAREDDERLEEPHYYYAQQDIAEASGIAWTCLRPHVVCGTTSIGTPQNILSVVGCYAALSKSLNRPLHWPGSEASFNALNQATDATLLAQSIVWALQAPSARNMAFNVTNGDFFRWSHLWPKVAELFDASSGGCKPQLLQESMVDMGAQWEKLVQEHNLKPYELARICDWSFADYILKTEWDVMASTIKIREAGFTACMDTEQMYLRHLSEMQRLHILP